MSEEVLSKCATCCHAKWNTTSNGRRHPSGAGTCEYELPNVPLPKWSHQWSWRHDQLLMDLHGLVSKYGGSRDIWYREHQPRECPTWAAVSRG